MPVKPYTNNYSNIDMPVPRWRFWRTPLYNIPSGSVVVSQNAANTITFKLPANTPFNLSRSKIPYQYVCPAGTSSQYTVTYEDGCSLFRNIQLTDGSQDLCNLNYADVLTHSSRPLNTDVDELLTKEVSEEFYPGNSTVAANIFPFSTDSLTVGSLNNTTVNYLENQKIRISTTPATALNVSRMFKLSDLKGTIFAMDKDLIFNQEMYINIVPQYGSRIFFYTTNPASPNNGTNATYTGNITLSNMYLQLAVQENDTIKNILRSDLNSGKLSMSVPWTTSNRYSSGNNVPSFTASLGLPKIGRWIKSITFVPVHASEFTSCFSWCSNNRNGSMIQQIQTFVDSRPLTDAPVNCYNPNDTYNPSQTSTTTLWANPSDIMMDWREMNKFTYKTAMLNYQMYQTQWLYKDNWGELDQLCPVKNEYPYENLNDGLECLLSGDHTYQVIANSPCLQFSGNMYYSVGVLFYIFVTYLRTLTITPGGIAMSN